MSDYLSRAKAAAGAAYKKGKKAVKSYLKPDTEAAAKKFDYKQSAKNRTESAAKAKRINETSKKQRVSGRAKSRANEQARVHGRSDKEKIKSKAVSSRNSKVIRDVALAAAPGGAASGAVAKVGLRAAQAKRVIKTAKTVSKLGKRSGGKNVVQKAVKGAKTYAKGVVKKTKEQGTKKITNKATSKALAYSKKKGKMKAQGYANKKAGETSKA